MLVFIPTAGKSQDRITQGKTSFCAFLFSIYMWNNGNEHFIHETDKLVSFMSDLFTGC